MAGQPLWDKLTSHKPHLLETSPGKPPLFLLVAPDLPKSLPGVVKIKLGGFGDALVEVAEVGVELINNEGSFQYRQPVLHGGQADAGIVGEPGIIERLPGMARTNRKKTRKEIKVSNIPNLPDIALYISFQVTGEKSSRRKSTRRLDLRIPQRRRG